jgi:hypothetical protein
MENIITRMMTVPKRAGTASRTGANHRRGGTARVREIDMVEQMCIFNAEAQTIIEAKKPPEDGK